MTNLEWALSYASAGYAVFPCHWPEFGGCSCGQYCHSPAKHPLVQHGVKDATKSTEQIKKWWVKWPEANIAIATGEISGVVVLDLDTVQMYDARNIIHNEIEPWLTYRILLASTSLAVKTKKGYHAYFQYDNRLKKNLVRAMEHVDIRSNNGYVIAPPSIHVSGYTYRWLTKVKDGSNLGKPPLFFLKKVHKKTYRDVVVSGAPKYRLETYQISPMEKGERNNKLASIAGRLLFEDRPLPDAEKFLVEVNKYRCRPPVKEKEVVQIVRGIYRRYHPPK